MENERRNNNEDNFPISPILIALITIFITIVIFFIYKAKKSARKAILITGLCNSGKTLLYSRLVLKRFVETHTSMKENIGDYLVDKSTLRIVDVPGHERVREKFFEKYKNEAKALIYVIDSSLIQQEVRDVAEYLYNILSDAVVANNKFKVLILCNKQDVPLSKNSVAIKSILEKELTMLQRTKSSQLDSVDPKVKKAECLVDGNNFDFTLLSPIQVDFANSHITGENKESVDIDELEKWLGKVA